MSEDVVQSAVPTERPVINTAVERGTIHSTKEQAHLAVLSGLTRLYGEGHPRIVAAKVAERQEQISTPEGKRRVLARLIQDSRTLHNDMEPTPGDIDDLRRRLPINIRVMEAVLGRPLSPEKQLQMYEEAEAMIDGFIGEQPNGELVGAKKEVQLRRVALDAMKETMKIAEEPGHEPTVDEVPATDITDMVPSLAHNELAQADMESDTVSSSAAASASELQTASNTTADATELHEIQQETENLAKIAQLKAEAETVRKNIQTSLEVRQEIAARLQTPGYTPTGKLELDYSRNKAGFEEKRIARLITDVLQVEHTIAETPGINLSTETNAMWDELRQQSPQLEQHILPLQIAVDRAAHLPEQQKADIDTKINSHLDVFHDVYSPEGQPLAITPEARTIIHMFAAAEASDLTSDALQKQVEHLTKLLKGPDTSFLRKILPFPLKPPGSNTWTERSDNPVEMRLIQLYLEGHIKIPAIAIAESQIVEDPTAA
jgi:hypothetical protein